jgi:S-DNA-T family DNA segregation ATPase FtsK/SpoIIIE
MSKKGSTSKKRRRAADEDSAGLQLDPHVSKEIKVILLAVAAVIIFLGLIGAAGAAGAGINAALGAFFGLNKFLVPLLFVGWAVQTAYPDRLAMTLMSKVGLGLLLASWGGLVNLIALKTPETMLEVSRLAEAGGYVGLLISYPLIRLADFWAATIILIGLVTVALVMTFRLSLRQGWELLKSVPARLADRTASHEEYEEDEEGEYDEYDEDDEETEEEDEAAETDEEEAGDEADGAPVFTGKSVGGLVGGTLFGAGRKNRKKLPPISIPIDLLEHKTAKPTSGDIHGRSMTIRKTLENFGIPVEMGQVSVGPTVTQFTLKPADGVKLSKITSLSNDLALSLAAHPIRIEAPIPGKSLVGIEVPNQGVAVVGLREVLDSEEFKQARQSSLTVCLGKDVAGKPWVADLGKMPHMLVAGATGSGKTVCLNTIILSLLYQNSPDDLRLLLIDPKRVELPVYNGIPHMLVPAVTDVNKTINSLKWCIEEMDRRFETLSQAGCRDIGSYNRQNEDDKMPYIVVVIDELADLMVAAASEVEASIIRLAQMARAVGIHLVVATQRPSVDVITGLIKANITARIAFSVASSTDSRTILDTPGAEKLVGRGDSLYQNSDLSKPKRIQCCYVGDADIRKVVDYITGQMEEPVEYIHEVVEKKSGNGHGAVAGGADSDDYDELLDEAKMTVIKAGKASASYLQRRLKVGYARAARLLDLLEEQGVIGPGDGAKPREILVSPVHDVDGYHLSDSDEE